MVNALVPPPSFSPPEGNARGKAGERVTETRRAGSTGWDPMACVPVARGWGLSDGPPNQGASQKARGAQRAEPKCSLLLALPAPSQSIQRVGAPLLVLTPNQFPGGWGL